MITLPPEFTATKYPGYFWNTVNKKLYSIKIGGVLRPLCRCSPNQFNYGEPGYKVSVNGEKKYIWEKTLMKLKTKDSVIPVQQQK